MAGETARGLLLDTHVWIWLMGGDPGRLAEDALAAVERAAAEGAVHIAAISVWEVAMLENKGRLRLGVDCLTWVREALGAPGIRLVPLSPEIAVASAYLPGAFHGDPADRMLVATARTHDLTLVSKDERILAYGAAGFLATLAA
jgi:PIN domain nuclease of toxin-antitoxin system